MILHIAIPLLDELDNLPTLLSCIEQQTNQNFELYLCVNQPESWWKIPEKVEICYRNQSSIQQIESWKLNIPFPLTLIDRSSVGKGWDEEHLGVGWARKTLMDEIQSKAAADDIIISLDADTTFKPSYFQSVIEHFTKHPRLECLAVPYYHPLTADEQANRAILRYEIYMRYYLLNLMEIKSPYAFTALGSAMVFRLKALRKLGGFTPKKSGEDFYFLQKMVKYKGIGLWLNEKVFPATRFSDRVFFGTGPAMIKGKNGDWNSYPLYPMSLFKQIQQFYQLIPQLFERDIDTPIDNFLGEAMDRSLLWAKFRNNHKDLSHFTRAIHQYFDGLRILQFLKHQNTSSLQEENLIEFITKKTEFANDASIFKNIDFKRSRTEQLNSVRDYLCRLEDIKRQEHNYNQWTTN